MSSIIPSLSILNIYRRGGWQPCIEMILLPILHKAVNPPRLQILRIDGKGMMNNVMMTMAHDVICGKKKKHEKDVVGIVLFDLIGLLPTNQIIAYITMAYGISEFVRNRSVLTVK